MEAGFTITKPGWKLLAKLLAGDKLEITKVMVGSGKVPEGANPGEITELVQPVALATSSIPQVEDKQVSFIVEYRSDLNGGLTEGFWLNEFGVFATDPDEGEILLYYATMGDYPQYVSAYSGQAVDVRRYPVVIAMSECYNVELKPPAGAWVTFAELTETLKRRGYHSNPTLLLNGDFRKPVNRNGKSEYTGAGYTIDRWYLDSKLKINIMDEFIRITKTETGSNPGFRQKFEFNDLTNQVVTFSMFCRTSSPGIRMMISPANILSIPISDNWSVHSITATISEGSFGAWENSLFALLQFTSGMSAGGYIDVKAVKLEPGDQQTLAHQDADGNWVLNNPPNYDLQYALCSQYSPITGEFVGSQHSNENLLDNARWDNIYNVINQRGQTEYTSAGYAIDRWYLSANSNLSITGEGITLNGTLSQYMSGSDFDWLIGKSVTISILVGEQLYSKTGTVLPISSGAQNFISLTIDDVSVLRFGYSANSARYYFQFSTQNLEPIAAKLELGPVQTLAHKEGDTWVLNDPAPNKALELAKCQRYQNVLQQWIRVLSVSHTINSVDYYISLATTPRIAPSTASITAMLGTFIIFALSPNLSINEFVCSVCTNSGNGLLIRLMKENHGITYFPALEIAKGALFDFNL